MMILVLLLSIIACIITIFIEYSKNKRYEKIAEFKNFNLNKTDFSLRNFKGETLLMSAICNNNIEAVEFLMSHQADVNEVDYNKNNSIIFAVKNNSKEILLLLLRQKNVNLNLLNVYKETAFSIALSNNNRDIIKLLEEKENEMKKYNLIGFKYPNNFRIFNKKIILISILILIVMIVVYYNYNLYNQLGFNRQGIHKITKEIYDEYGYDRNGKDRDGYNRDGYNKDGYNRKGYDRLGYNKEGFNEKGYSKFSYSKSEEKKNSEDKITKNNNLDFSKKKSAEDFAIIFVAGMLGIPESSYTSVNTINISEDTYITNIYIDSKIIKIKVAYVNGVLNVISADM